MSLSSIFTELHRNAARTGTLLGARDESLEVSSPAPSLQSLAPSPSEVQS